MLQKSTAYKITTVYRYQTLKKEGVKKLANKLYIDKKSFGLTDGCLITEILVKTDDHHRVIIIGKDRFFL